MKKIVFLQHKIKIVKIFFYLIHSLIIIDILKTQSVILKKKNYDVHYTHKSVKPCGAKGAICQ